ncbi:MAG: hypothetical protein LUO86_03170 [Methanomicrobiales archaeon]|nr:hypothetical protein [Methanomicrobiales archaeon]
MSATSETLLGVYLNLFAATEVFIYVFMEIVTKLEPVQKVIFKKAQRNDYLIFILIFGLFSIFGTYLGIPERSGAITNIRDLAPMVAGFVAGPYVGVAVGLIGGIHRIFLGGVSAVPCSLATILAGLLAGLVYHFRKGKLPGIISGMLYAAGIEILHGLLVLAMIHPYAVAREIIFPSIPEMIIANSLGVGISIIIIHSLMETEKHVAAG